MIILIDNGHGSNTAGKRSPDKRFYEYRYAREIAADVCANLQAMGYDARRIVTEEKDVPLNAGANSRVKRVNDVCRKHGADNVLLVSIHCNAAGNGSQWMSARGWSAHVALRASRQSKNLAKCLAEAARVQGLPVRIPLMTQDYWTQNLAICRDTLCPAVLTENLFQDNWLDVEFLLSDKGRAAIAGLHVDGIISYIHKFSKK